MNNTSQVRLSYLLLFLLVLILIAITVFNSPNYALPANTPSSTPAPSAVNIPSSTPIPDSTNTPYSTPPPDATYTPINPQAALQAAKDLVRTIFANLFSPHIAASVPKKMIRGKANTVELILSPSLSEAELVARMLDQSSFINNPINQKIILVPNGDSVSITTDNIEITPRMMASLKSVDSEAFVITAMHNSDEQLVIFTDTTTWRWSITAKKTGWQVLELSLYQIMKFDGQEIPQNVKRITAYVYVDDTFFGWLKSLDWKWIVTTLVALIIGFNPQVRRFIAKLRRKIKGWLGFTGKRGRPLAILRITQGPAVLIGAEFKIYTKTITLGRNPQMADMCFYDGSDVNSSLSDLHARIERVNARWQIVAISQSGSETFVEDSAIPFNEPYPIKYNCRIRLGYQAQNPVEFIFEEYVIIPNSSPSNA